MKIEFKGVIINRSSYVPGSGIYILSEDGTFDEAFAYAFPSNCYASVRYAISKTGEWPETLDEVAADTIAILEGKTKAEYYDRYSDLTGYLWTTEEAVVGGHNLISLLSQNVGKYLWMEVLTRSV